MATATKMLPSLGDAPGTFTTVKVCSDKDGREPKPFPYHPLSNLFPLMDGHEFDELVADVRLNGMRVPVVLCDGAILDGRNRYRAALLAGVEVPTVQFDWADPLSFVISANLHRRHLTTSQHDPCWRRNSRDMQQGARTDDRAKWRAMSKAHAANLLNVGRRSVQRAAALREHADPALVGSVKRGEITISAAVTSAKLLNALRDKIGTTDNREILTAAEQSQSDSQARPQRRQLTGEPATEDGIETG